MDFRNWKILRLSDFFFKIPGLFHDQKKIYDFSRFSSLSLTEQILIKHTWYYLQWRRRRPHLQHLSGICIIKKIYEKFTTDKMHTTFMHSCRKFRHSKDGIFVGNHGVPWISKNKRPRLLQVFPVNFILISSCFR